MTTKFKTSPSLRSASAQSPGPSRRSLAALLLLAIAAFVPACDILNKPCDPNVEVCVFDGNHPGTLDD